MAAALWFRSLLLNLPTPLTGFFWTIWILLQAPDVFLDLGTAGVDTEILCRLTQKYCVNLFGNKSMEKAEVLYRE